MNISYFLPNYVVVALLLSFGCIITSFWLLISAIIVALFFAYIHSKTANGPIVVGGEEIPSWILYAATIFAVIPLLILADVGYILYCAIGVSLLIDFIHALFFSALIDKAKLGTLTKTTQVVIVRTADESVPPKQSSRLLQPVTEASTSAADAKHDNRVRFVEEEDSS
ncbi:unnamed protein product [Enterobius vermicularis]|uniref:PRA1 family protein n=1 Tax=Enterobius vermicularis TaxID=51028 RepID=A0A158QA73_ENTVE|nr:unnamed protein product [Enterobius vermicularis]